MDNNLSRRKLLTLAGVLLIGLCLCVVSGASLASWSIWRGRAQKPDPQAALDAFMQAMAHKDPQAAYDLFSTRSKRHNTLASLEQILADNYVLFEGYAEIQIEAQDISTLYPADPESPQGTVAVVSGSILYTNAYAGSFNATLEWEVDQWRIDGINIAIPQEKKNDPSKQEGFLGPG